MNPVSTTEDIIVICRDRQRAKYLCAYFYRCCAHAVTKVETSRLTVVIGGRLEYRFISEAEEDIVLRGRHNPKVFRGEYIESILDKHMKEKEKNNEV